MELISQNLGLHLIIWQTGSKGQKTVMITVVGGISSTACCKGPLGTLFFNIAICELFLITDDFEIANYADYTTPFVWGKDITSVIKSLGNAAEIVLLGLKTIKWKVTRINAMLF